METNLNTIVARFVSAYVSADETRRSYVSELLDLLRKEYDDQSDPETFATEIAKIIRECLDDTPPQPPIIICERDKESPDGN
jgi:hypothetical protein